MFACKTIINFFSVPPFEATQYKVTNYEYMEFIENGGYSKMELWTKEGYNFNDH